MNIGMPIPIGISIPPSIPISIGMDAETTVNTAIDRTQRDLLHAKLNEMAQRYGLLHNGVPRLAGVATELLSNPCDKKSEFDLANGLRAPGLRFDAVFSELHDFAVGQVIGHLKSSLQEAGCQAAIASEVVVPLGRYDMLLTTGSPCRLLAGNKEILRLEIKTAKSFPLEQAIRYLWESDSPLIVARLLTRQVLTLRPNTLTEVLDFTLRETVLKADRIMKGEIQPTPGAYCADCGDAECHWNRASEHKRDPGIITIREFSADLQTVMTNIPRIAGEVATIAVRELQNINGDPN